MSAPGWLSCSRLEAPSPGRWLSSRELETLGGLRFPKRRSDWLLGRWTAKSAVGAWLGLPPRLVEILAAADGAPEAWIGGERAPVSVSISHRAGRALAAVTAQPAVGCDLELVEPRSRSFTREWLSEAEQELVGTAIDPALAANLIWTAKEAGAKVRRAGLRLDVRHAATRFGPGDGEWNRFTLSWPDVAPTAGWWRAEPKWVMAVAGTPPLEPPRRLS